MTENNHDQQDSICISRDELNAIVEKAAEKAVNNAAVKIGQTLACDLQDALRAINDELGRFADRLKNLEEWTNDYDSDVRAKEYQQRNELQSKSKTFSSKEKETVLKEQSGTVEPIVQKLNDTKLNKRMDKVTITHTEVGNVTRASQVNAGEQSRGSEPVDDADEGWIRVVGKNKRKGKTRRHGAVLIGGHNVSRIKAAAMDEFLFDQNVSFVTTNSDDLKQSLRSVTQRSKAKEIQVVIHLGAEDAMDHSPDYVLEKLSYMVENASKEKNVQNVSVCSLEERRDSGSNVHENIKTVNAELAQLCLSTGSTFLDLRPRLKESRFGGINKTGILYTFEGARNVAQHILSETPGFLD